MRPSMNRTHNACVRMRGQPMIDRRAEHFAGSISIPLWYRLQTKDHDYHESLPPMRAPMLAAIPLQAAIWQSNALGPYEVSSRVNITQVELLNRHVVYW